MTSYFMAFALKSVSTAQEDVAARIQQTGRLSQSLRRHSPNKP